MRKPLKPVVGIVRDSLRLKMYQKEVEYYHYTNKFDPRSFNISTEVSRNFSAADIRPIVKQCEYDFLGTEISDFFFPFVQTLKTMNMKS